MANGKLKVVFLVGADNASTRLSIQAVCLLPGIEPAGVLLDTGSVPFRRRFYNLVRNIGRNGWLYPLIRVLKALHLMSHAAVRNAAVSQSEVKRVLKEAFPEACWSLTELGVKHSMPIHSVGSLNSAEGASAASECAADLGIVLGTRILKPSTFRVPRLGCINLHKGRVPEYRGMPPGFWELYDGRPSAGVTVHFVDTGLDTGDIVVSGDVPILKTDTPESILEKLDTEGMRLLAAAVSNIRDGSATRQPQASLSLKPRTTPTRGQVKSLQKRLPHWKRPAVVPAIARNLYLLLVYYSGIYDAVRHWRRLQGSSRAAILLYHRVNDYSRDVLTVDTETFAAQLLAISGRYPLSSTAALVDCIRNRKPLQPTTVAIHFDDCYRDVLTNGAPVLKALRIPACSFINSGYVDTVRSFPHDAGYPFIYQMLRSSDVREWARLGFEIGAHTVNHLDLGSCTVEDATSEIVPCGQDLRKIAGTGIDLFSFPFGQPHNITSPVRRIIRESGYAALFSAHGGFIGPRTDLYDIPRLGSSCELTPVYCLLQIEGLAPSQIAAMFRGIRNTFTPASLGRQRPA